MGIAMNNGLRPLFSKFVHVNGSMLLRIQNYWQTVFAGTNDNDLRVL